MGISADLIKLKNGYTIEDLKKEITKQMDAPIGKEEENKIYSVVGYLGGREIQTDNTLSDYENDLGVFTLKDAITQNKISTDAIKKIDDYCEKMFFCDAKSLMYDESYLVYLGY